MRRFSKVLSVFLTCCIVLMSSGVIVFADEDIQKNNDTVIETESLDTSTSDQQNPDNISTDIVDVVDSVDSDNSSVVASDNVIDSNNSDQDGTVTSDTEFADSDLDTVNTDQIVSDTNTKDSDTSIISEDHTPFIVVNDDLDDIDLLDIDSPFSENSSNDLDLSESDSNIIFEEEIDPIILDADDFSAFDPCYGLVNTGSGYHRYSFSGVDSFNYNKLKNHASSLAYGSKSDAILEISLSELGLSDSAWTAKDLGVSALIVNSSLSAAAKNKINEKVVGNFAAVVTYLIYDMPFEFYWFNKESGLQIKGYSAGARYNNNGEIEVYLKGSVKYYFSVSSDYGNPSTYQVDASKVNRAIQATYNAQAIVDKYSSLSDLEKLTKYKEEICALVSYDKDAYLNNAPYGDPHQMISVFDNNPNTNVVCEGYSKAFKYLCDLSSFSSEVYCICIGGKMAGVSKAEEHMWNIVHYNGSNYLVDVTNSDGAASASDDQLFMKNATRLVNSNCYNFVCQGKSFNYTYDDDMRSILYTDEALTITTVALGTTTTTTPASTTTSTPTQQPVAQTTSTPATPSVTTSTSGVFRPTTGTSTGTYKPTTGTSTGTYIPTTGTSTGTYRPGTYIPTTGTSTGTYRPTTGTSTGTYRPGTYIPTTGSSTGTYKPTTGTSTGTYRPGTYIPTTGSSTGTYRPETYIPTTGSSTGTYRPGTYIPTTGSSTGTYKPTTGTSTSTYRPGTYIPTTGSSTGIYSPTTVSSVGTYRPATVTTGIYTSYRTGSSNIVFSWDYFVA